MKDKLKKLLQAKEARKADLSATAKTTASVDELRSINMELDALNVEIVELRSMLTDLDDINEGNDGAEGGSAGDDGIDDGEQRSNPPVGKSQVLGSFGLDGKPNEARQLGRYETPEYRQAFMDYVLTGEVGQELRADATTNTTSVSAVIPTTIMNKVVEKMVDYGRIWARVSKSSVKAGLEIPVASLKPTASWLAEGVVADKQKKTITGKISFSYHKLQVRIAVTLEADTVTLPVFEATVAENVQEAMIVAIESAIINGTGTGQPLGITNDTDIPADQQIDVAVAEMDQYDTWTKLFGKVPRKYRNGAVLIMNDADWSKYIAGMTDANGQPVARTTYGLEGAQSERLLGKEVIAIEDYLPSIDDANVGDVVGIICKLSDYLVNTNLQMSVRRYFDENTDEYITKSTMLADGKLADHNGVVLLKKQV